MALARRHVIGIDQKLILIVVARLTQSRETLARKGIRPVDGLRRRNQIRPIGQFEVQKFKRNRIDVGTVRQDRDAAQRTLHSGEQLTQRGSGTIVCDRRRAQADRASGSGLAGSQRVDLPRALIRTEEEQLIPFDWTTQVEAELILL